MHMKPTALNRIKTGRFFYLLMACLPALMLFASGCTRMLSSHYAKAVSPQEGKIYIEGPGKAITVRRDDMGIPFIEAENMKDLAFAMGYVHASDRLTQMATFKLVSQGRLSEMVGRPGADLDIFMRTLNLTKTARTLLDELSPQRREFLGFYARGVNAYIDQNRDRLPPGLSLSGYTPEKWEMLDSISIAALLGLGLSFNMNEEADSLALIRAVGPQKAAWLFPIHPEEPIPFDEIGKLEGMDLKGKLPSLQRLSSAGDMFASLGLANNAASNNWAISRERTAGNASILANDTHLLLSLPSLWTMMHIRCKDLDAAGIVLAGLPGIIAGYNGHFAWGMTMVMADSQDLFLEKIKDINGKPHYFYKESWRPVKDREETILVRGKGPVHFTVRETIHGPLINDILAHPPKSPVMPDPIEVPFGIALSWAAAERGDKTLDAFFSLAEAKSVNEALPIVRELQAIALNMVLADRDNIAWQVTGRYPVRKKGRGLIPSPGWTGEYDWTGMLGTDKFPHSLNPPEGYVGTANNKTVGPDYPYILSSSWYWPDRIERISDMITRTKGHTFRTSMDMQLDTFSLSAVRIRKLLLEGDFAGAIGREIDSWKDRDMQEKAREALALFRDFDCNMAACSRNALAMGVFNHVLTREIFFDELGPRDSTSWKSFVFCNSASYNATTDHLFLRGDESPFWDDIKTPGRETKVGIVARSLARSIDIIEKKLGKDRSTWSWGKLHTYHFMTEASRMAPNLGLIQRLGLAAVSPYFNRDPFPAPGDHTTLNVSNYMIGRDFNTWIIPAMRMVADFSLKEPFYAVNSTGQSDNPSSPHYDDGIRVWREGRYLSFPFAQDRIEKQYHKVLVLEPAGR